MDKLICIGKNYLEHAKELGDTVPKSPVLFLKPPSSVVQVGDQNETVQVKLPRGRGVVHPECEIVLRLDSRGEIDAVTLGLDMTLRDVQTSLKKSGHPWEISKVFHHSAVIGPWIELSKFQNYLEIPFLFNVDNSQRQKACGKEMRFSPKDCLNYIRECFPVCQGDVVFTGTPAGVNSVESGQLGELIWEDRLSFRVNFE